MKYIDAEKLIAEIKGLQCEQGFEDGMEERGYQFAIKDILDIIASLQQEQPSLPSNLDEAAEEYGRKEYAHAIHFWDEGLSKNKPEVMKEDFVGSFKAGVEWMAGQGETRIVCANADLDPHGADYGIRSLYIRLEDNIPVGTKFIVQIRKK